MQQVIPYPEVYADDAEEQLGTAKILKGKLANALYLLTHQLLLAARDLTVNERLGTENLTLRAESKHRGHVLTACVVVNVPTTVSDRGEDIGFLFGGRKCCHIFFEKDLPGISYAGCSHGIELDVGANARKIEEPCPSS